MYSGPRRAQPVIQLALLADPSELSVHACVINIQLVQVTLLYTLGIMFVSKRSHNIPLGTLRKSEDDSRNREF